MKASEMKPNEDINQVTNEGLVQWQINEPVQGKQMA